MRLADNQTIMVLTQLALPIPYLYVQPPTYSACFVRNAIAPALRSPLLSIEDGYKYYHHPIIIILSFVCVYVLIAINTNL